MTTPRDLRLAVLSDIHGNLPALQAVMDDLSRRQVDGVLTGVLTLGDHLSGPLWPLDTARRLMAQTGWLQIAGNHERQILQPGPSGQRGASDAFAHAALGEEELAWLAALPATALWRDPAADADDTSGGVLLCHGTPDDDITGLMETLDDRPGRHPRLASAQELDERLSGPSGLAPDVGVVLCGHTHTPRAMRWRGRLLLNPGSVGLPAYSAGGAQPHKVETGSPDARYALLERRSGIWSALLIALPYDYAAAARQAQANGRPEWAHALATGFMP
ncbi:metallophosphoesterase family protein [Amphibiibacter pelophylacis]|uniref:Metallophosphoesterase family protein n=1 Tax=Amphibiibacter pelophylacis TaxID=1799477 RepID=A0ACC6P355_9BURK